MCLTCPQCAAVPFEDNYGVKQIVVSDKGKVVVIGIMEDNSWWLESADGVDQGPAGVTMDELRSRAKAIRIALGSHGLPEDNITALALAMIGLDSAGWSDGFNANDFHKGVVRLSPYVLTDGETTTVYDADGTRIEGVGLERRSKGEKQ